MGDYLYSSVPVVVLHVPDSSMEIGPDGNRVNVELPGHVEIGVNVGGAFIPLAKMGKARFDKKLAAAQANQPAPADTPPAGQG